MSRSSDLSATAAAPNRSGPARRSQGVRRLEMRVRVPVLIVSCLAWVSSMLTWAAPFPAEAAPRPDAPVVAISARVIDIVVSTTDPKREMRVDRSRDFVRVTLDATVLFGKDSAAIRSSSAVRLSVVAGELRRRGAGRVRIVGYTDDLGSAAHGMDLSRRRARAVAVALRGELPTARYPFTVIGRGEAGPVVPNTSEANRRINRRVVVTHLTG